jgi:hypothetical protein
MALSDTLKKYKPVVTAALNLAKAYAKATDETWDDALVDTVRGIFYAVLGGEDEEAVLQEMALVEEKSLAGAMLSPFVSQLILFVLGRLREAIQNRK